MKIELHRITIRELVEGYVDDVENGVRGYGGRLDIRPPYQREFVYKEKERNAVITTVMRGFPLNVMYWVRRQDGNFEVMDGQQRTISICQYANGDFSWGELDIGARFFHRQPEDIRERFLNYELMVYFCEGTESEKIDWFKVINIAGLRLTDQEMRNAVYSGPWVNDAKRYFSKSGCVAQKVGSRYLNGNADRQEYLETAIIWMINSAKDKAIEEYMAIHQGDAEATELWLHFQTVINWVETLFPKYRREMKGLEWGRLYAEFSSRRYDPRRLETDVAALMADREVQKKSGVYEFLLSDRTRPEKLNLRAFDDDDKREAYERQGGICPVCRNHFAFEEMEGDHIIPWSKGGKTVPENLQMLCRRDNALKRDKFSGGR
ncbi:MAG: DUF262 domain-containing protein [Kiritimatiellae bacterium]|nr:DUF262 domain-containing protein [Kiritimatiellia bacterium]